MLSLFERRKKENINIETSLHNNVFFGCNKLIGKPTPINKNSNNSYRVENDNALLSNNKFKYQFD